MTDSLNVSYTLIQKVPEEVQHKFTLEDFEHAMFVALEDAGGNIRQVFENETPTNRVFITGEINMTTLVSIYGQWLVDAGIINT
jgi:hypothetical protein